MSYNISNVKCIDRHNVLVLLLARKGVYFIKNLHIFYLPHQKKKRILSNLICFFLQKHTCMENQSIGKQRNFATNGLEFKIKKSKYVSCSCMEIPGTWEVYSFTYFILEWFYKKMVTKKNDVTFHASSSPRYFVRRRNL
jgi:hypothetical protein